MAKKIKHLLLLLNGMMNFGQKCIMKMLKSLLELKEKESNKDRIIVAQIQVLMMKIKFPMGKNNKILKIEALEIIVVIVMDFQEKL